MTFMAVSIWHFEDKWFIYKFYDFLRFQQDILQQEGFL